MHTSLSCYINATSKMSWLCKTFQLHSVVYRYIVSAILHVYAALALFNEMRCLSSIQHFVSSQLYLVTLLS